ncbi:hypothetical protein PVAND_002169 [Polypedilum vanderplanki]|uniref:Uncharacterized protein n=1 Tax=Polypedilum vanderplanki TaxID=319348 RepID=A0A9J6BRL7_POLVA|nr:hypothetical protein PVAND_002169 [Polypedilum vanderplanki]
MFQCIIQQRNGWIHVPSQEFRDVFPDIRLQLNEQLRCLDIRVESQISLIQELQEFYRRRGELELDYSKNLEKLAKNLQLRHKEQKQKREQWPMFSTHACWQQLIQQTKSLARDHATLADIYSTQLVQRLQSVYDDCQRIYKRCREVGYEIHEEILRVLQELHTTMKTYHGYQLECREAEKKLRAAEVQRAKIQQSIPKEKLDRNKKFKVIEKEVLKRKNKYTDARLKALKAKNEYQLCLEASNTTIHKYFVEDLSDLIDCMDLGFHSVISRALLLHVTADQGRCRQVLNNSELLSHIIHSMDSRADKQKFLEQYHSAFMIPKRLEFQGGPQEDLIVPSQKEIPLPQPSLTTIVECELQKTLNVEMDQRLTQLVARTNHLKMESDEIWKTVETAEINLLEILNQKDYDVSNSFGTGNTGSDNNSMQSFQLQYNYSHNQHTPKLNDSMSTKLRNDKQEIEEFYLSKIREYILCTSRIARLDSKAEFLRNALTKDSNSHNNNSQKPITVPKRKRIGRMNLSGRPKLFGGSLEEYLEATGEEIPLIVRSCIRVINLYGLHHQGIFRVSGSQVEITNFREWFERGEDPLAEVTDASDINSIAGVMKLYLRELREPLFPTIYFDHLISLAQIESKHDMVMGVRKFLQALPRSVVCVMRYLFAFLNHLSEYADENMMSAYNLAICFGPTLMRTPDDKDQVQYQNQINALIESMIVFHEDLFPKDLPGIKYEKYITPGTYDDIDIGDSPTEQNTEDPDTQSEDDSDSYEATALFDFDARSERELSFRKGDNIQLYNQISGDWWKACINGKVGLVADKFISLKIKGEERSGIEKHSGDFLMKSSSSEESVRKRSHSVGGNSLAPSTLSTMTTTNICDINDAVMDSKQDIIDGTKKYVYHDEPHSFETSMDYLVVSSNNNSMNESNADLDSSVTSADSRLATSTSEHIYSNSHFKFENSEEHDGNKKPSEPIYAEPSKIQKPQPSTINNEYQPLSIFQQNREKWQKRASVDNSVVLQQACTLQPQSSVLSINSRPQSAILTRKQPDLVIDLPPPSKQDNITPPLSSGSTSASSSMTSLDHHQVINDEANINEYDDADETLGDHFAKQNQSTLKKNEKFSSIEGPKKIITEKSEASSSSKASNKIEEIVLRIEESSEVTDTNRLSTGSTSSLMKIELEKSPIPLRNTQKFVNQFADLKLTGGSRTISPKTATTPTETITTANQSDKSEKERTSFSLGSFKPTISMKPQVLTKKKSIFLQAHSSSSTQTGSSQENPH